MSRAARDPLPADELPALRVLQVVEAAPNPPPGPVRDGIAAVSEARLARATGAMEAAVDGYADRLLGVVQARLRGPKARKGTRWWAERAKPEEKSGGNGTTSTYSPVATVEYKALDAAYVLPDRAGDEITDVVRPVALRIVSDASDAVAEQLGIPGVGLATFDQQAVDDAVADAVARMLGVAQRHAEEIREAITGADADADTLDEVLERVAEAHRRGGNWLRLSGRTLATALANDAATAAARALGCTHAQWVSRRDERVRPGHVVADGQVRVIGVPFLVGGFPLLFPGDPSGLPATWPQVANCRCSLLYTPPEEHRSKATRLARNGSPDAARRAAAGEGVHPDELAPSAPELGTPTVPAQRLPADTVGYRVLDAPPRVQPGQRLSLAEPVVLALAPPAAVAARAALLTVALPAGALVGQAGGAVVVGGPLEVLQVTAGRIVARPVEVTG